MGLRFRRSLKVIPGVRINFGLRGLSATVGGRGASVNFGSRGTYLNVGIPGSGLSYRTRLDSPTTQRPPAPQTSPGPSSTVSYTPEYEYKSVPVSQLGSKSLDRFLALVQESKSRRETIADLRKKGAKKLGKAEGYLGSFLIALRRRISPQHVALMTQYRVDMADYVEDLDAAFEANKLCVDFNLSDEAKSRFVETTNSFQNAKSSERIWDITTGRRTNKRAERTIASESIERVNVRLATDDDDLLETGFQVPVLTNANGADLLIYPAFLVARESRRKFSLIDLRTVRIEGGYVRFNETDGVPSDAKIVGYTWEKANKDGSRDKRFNANREIPRAAYYDLTLSSEQGLLERWMFSNEGAAIDFVGKLSAFQSLLPRGGKDTEDDAPPEVAELGSVELPEPIKSPPVDWRETSIKAGLIAASLAVFLISKPGQQSIQTAQTWWQQRDKIIAKAQAELPVTPPAVSKLIDTAKSAISQKEIRPLNKAEVSELQTFLKTKGYYKSAVDGVTGPGTRAGAVKFLKATNRPAEYADDTRVIYAVREDATRP